MFNKKNIVALPALSILLCSASPYNVYSSLTKNSFTVVEVISKGYQNNQVLSNVKQLEAASISVDYEYYQMGNNTVLLTNYVPAYQVIYKAEIYLNNKVQYKGGIFNWLDGEHPAYINSLLVNASFEGVTNVNKAYQTPYSVDGFEIKIADRVNPFDPEEDSIYNSFSGVHGPSFLFTTAASLNSSSYYYNSISICNVSDLVFDSRLCAILKTSSSLSNKTQSFSQEFLYGHPVDKYDGTVLKDKREYFSGPWNIEKGGPDSNPFIFRIYGSFGLESATKPSKMKLAFTMNTTYGSAVVSDNFTNDTRISF
ncbi:MAG: hypothetical protein WCR67_06375 [Bacilli bacterium]